MVVFVRHRPPAPVGPPAAGARPPWLLLLLAAAVAVALALQSVGGV